MERAVWKFVCCLVSLLFLELCNGLPIGLDHTYGDGHTQFLTGLIAILLTVCGVVCLAGCLCCQRKNGFKEFQNTVIVESNDSDHGHINPLASTANANRNEFTIFNPLTKETPITNVFTQQEVIVHNTDDWKHDNIDVRGWFDNGESEFPRTRLKYIRELGKGWFGRVVEGTAQGLDVTNKEAWQTVVVRILEASASSRQRALFLHDAGIYRCTPHPNILLLFARSLDNVPLLLLQEYTNQGDLKSFLLKQQQNKETFLNGDLPLRWCYHLTSAMKHLHLSNIVHLDLATRNCRLTDTMDLKLGDYGCSTTDYPADYYHGTENMPIRWCAPESVTCTATTIQTKNVTQCGNIWSLGVCYWEVYECGEQPYCELTDDEVVSKVLGPPHIRLQKPKVNVLFTDYMYRLMQLCWSNSELRPTINQIYPIIADLVQVHKNATPKQCPDIDFDQRWDNLKPNHHLNFSDNPSLSIPSNNSEPSLDSELHLEFKLGPLDTSALRTSSESETEDENWKRKVERGLYTEKVRQKSRSVADLMILTHIDCSESDSETPLPSISYKNVRYAAKQNLENVSVTFGSEGNLLSVQNTFEEELRKLQEERRDSLLFVPEQSPAKKLLEDLNSPAAIEPQSQVFNVYNVVTISPTISPVHHVELNKIINLNEDEKHETKREIPKLSEIIENNIELMDYIIAKYDPEDELHVEIENEEVNVPENNVAVVKQEVECEVNECNVLSDRDVKCESESDEYVTANTHVSVTDTCDELTDNTSGSEQKLRKIDIIGTLPEEVSEASSKKELSESLDDETEDFYTPSSQQNSDSADIDEITDSDRTYCCDKPNNIQETLEIVPNAFDNNEDNKVQNNFLKEEHRTQIETLQNVLNETYNSQKHQENPNQTISMTQDFLNNEILTYEDSNTSLTLSERQEIEDESLNIGFTSTPFHKRTKDATFTQNGGDSQDQELEGKKSDLKYSLETWDNFLGRSFDEQHEHDDFSQEPMSLLFSEDKHQEDNFINRTNLDQMNGAPTNDATFVKETPEIEANATFVKETPQNATFVKEDQQESETFINQVDSAEEGHLYDNRGYWEPESSGGWYLHPQDQSDAEDLQGEIDLSQDSQEDDSYVRFSVDDEVMAAIRNELMMKLPQAQKAACEQVEDADGEYETTDRNEVFLRYNCFNTPLSPIPEESYSEYLNSGQSTPHCTINTDLAGSESDSDWSEGALGGPHSLDEDTHSPRLLESPHKGTHNRHTPSQDSCCSNDTLFNLEELQYNEKQLQEIEERKRRTEENEHYVRMIVGDLVEHVLTLADLSTNINTNSDNDNDADDMNHTLATPSESDNIDSMPSSLDVTVIKLEVDHEQVDRTPQVVIQEFIDNERTASLSAITITPKEMTSHLTTSVCYALQHIAPLNSPEDRPWKHIEASLALSKCPEIAEDEAEVEYDYIDKQAAITDKYEKEMNLKNLCNMANEDIYDCIAVTPSPTNNLSKDYVNEPSYVNTEESLYANTNGELDLDLGLGLGHPEVDYENINNHSFDDEDDEEDFGPLGDIRFTGPGDLQMMTTSFSESNDLGDEHDWDSGSDTRSSSSGEFIWKEGEHEASVSVKALQAQASQEETKGNDIKDEEDSSSCSDEDCDGIEFVPSAWDKFATPTKSAMRSPERSLRKERGVSFKKQKYHCVYEYPREPETSVIENYELWKNPTYMDWDLGRSDPFLPGSSDYETASASDLNLIPKQHVNYDFTGSNLDDDFYISSSAKPFDMLGSATSQFFPGKHCDWSDLIKNNDNVTPDSGVEDITPGSLSDSSDYVRPNRQILPLKTLAQLAANRNVNVGANEIGGLRHTRNRLKLDLPPSPNAFTKTKSFTIDSPEHPVIQRQIPTFTTFGKSRFSVQQVDTSMTNCNDGDLLPMRNVSFEALPYKPMSKLVNIKNDLNGHAEKSRIEVVRGEASLLDSADEDSGIESCTLERKNVSEVSEVSE